MGKLNRRKHHYWEVPSKTETSQTADILQTIKVIIHSTWNRKYMLKYVEKESREMYVALRRYCKKHYGNSDRATLLRTLALMREWLVDQPNRSLAHIFLYDIIIEKNKC